MKKYVFESLKFFCAAILCLCLSAFTSPSWAANCNLFDVSALQSGTSSGVTLSVASDGEITVNGTTELTYYSSFVASLPTPLTAGTYTLSLNNSQALPNSPSNLVGCVVNNAIGPRSASLTVPNASNTFVVDEGTQCERIEIRIEGPADNFKFKIKLEKGSTATPYQPYNPSCGCDGTVVNYVSATGTVSQSGTPTPDNPIEPTFYKQGNMVLRKVGDVADSYDATTGKITRRVGVKVFNGTEAWTRQQSTYNNKVYYRVLETLSGAPMSGGNDSELSTVVCNILPHKVGIWYKGEDLENGISGCTGGNGIAVSVVSTYPTVNDWTSYLAQQYAAGTPVTVYYPLATEVVEDWTEISYCETPIKIATTKYNETAFGPLNTALANAISVVDSVVTQTIEQAENIAKLQTQKQTRPADDPTDANNAENCPAGKKCLLVEDASGVPHWYEIVENAWDLPVGYTQLNGITNGANTAVATGIQPTVDDVEWELRVKPSTDSWYILQARSGGQSIWGVSGSQTGSTILLGWNGNQSLLRSGITRNTTHIYYVKATVKNGVATLYVKDETDNTEDTQTTTYTFDATQLPSSQFYLFANGNPQYVAAGNNVFMARIKVGGVTVMDYVPALNPSNIVGFYDKATGDFKVSTTGTLVAGPVSE